MMVYLGEKKAKTKPKVLNEKVSAAAMEDKF